MPAPAQQLELSFAPVIIPRGDGTYLVRPGKPVIPSQDITAAAAAKILGCSVHSVYRYIREGHLTQVRQVKRRGKIRLNRAEVEELAGRQHDYAADPGDELF